MSKDYAVEKNIKDTTCTQNRELSWLRFNQRVLEEAMDETVPLLERLKFISIFTSNLDEFFMVRVGSLVDLMLLSNKDTIDNKTGWSPKEQLEAIFNSIPPLMEKRDEAFRTVSMELRQRGIYDLSFDELSKEEEKDINKYFEYYINPILSPQIVDNRHPIPHLKNRRLYIASILKTKKDKTVLGIIPIPSSIPRILPSKENRNRYIRIENVIMEHIDKIFDIYNVVSSNIISVTRNADISYDDDKFEDNEHDYLDHMNKLLKKRDWLLPVRLEIQGIYNDNLTEILRSFLKIEKNQIFYSLYPIKLEYVYGIEHMVSPLLKSELTYPKLNARQWESLNPKKSIIEQIRHKDVLLFFPFEKIDPFLALLEEAGKDPNVLSIKITIYRLASDSKVANLLLKAAENGKEVTVLMELRARFDEKHNILWAERLSEAGCRVIYGEEGFKCHSKICLITRKDKNGIEYITQIGTGNYNEKTAAMYTDLSLITMNKDIGKDATNFFQNMLIGNLKGNYETLLVAPNSLKQNILKFMDEEIEKGSRGRIIMKANSLTDIDVIYKLIEASKAGVKIQMIIRGICCIRPGIYNKTDNISISSIVGRFLEHSRIYVFGSGEDKKIFISSADLMTRNLDKRVEIACPIFDYNIRNQIDEILEIILRDNVKARVLQTDDTYRKKAPFGMEMIDSQDWFLNNSLKTYKKEKENNNKLTDFFKNIFNK